MYDYVSGVQDGQLGLNRGAYEQLKEWEIFDENILYPDDSKQQIWALNSSKLSGLKPHYSTSKYIHALKIVPGSSKPINFIIETALHKITSIASDLIPLFYNDV